LCAVFLAIGHPAESVTTTVVDAEPIADGFVTWQYDGDAVTFRGYLG